MVVALRNLAKRLTSSVEDLHDERLRKRFAGLDVTPIAEVAARQRVRVAGEVARLRTVPRNGVPTLQARLRDGTGELDVEFVGRRTIGGIDPGRHLLVEGVAHDERGRLVVLNPSYELQ